MSKLKEIAKPNTVIFWHRRDLRIHDNAGLYKALNSGFSVVPIFIFDTEILDKLPKNDQRIIFIREEIIKLQDEYRKNKSDMAIYVGNPTELLPLICKEFKATKVFTNRDYEPYSRERDENIYDTLKQKQIEFLGSKDHVIFEKNEVLKDDNSPYVVFTPFSRKWKEKLNEFYLKSYPTEKYKKNLHNFKSKISLTCTELGFGEQQTVSFPEKSFPEAIIKTYNETRDFPSKKGTSKLGIHLRFGTISIRELTKFALKNNATYLNELIWREFYQMIIYHFPNSAKNEFRKDYENIPWINDEKHFELWCEGKTGYPLVDAGMRELNETGYMHNRVRMVVASFLTKHLLTDWRWGETYFAEKLLDYELASNVGGWQWAAGCGCDAAPYFRVFNPQLQLEKFDQQEEYVKKWVSEFGTKDYPEPIVEHKMARERAIQKYKEGLGRD